jgi:hypothetical protein
VLNEPNTVWNKTFVENLDTERLAFDPAAMAAEYAMHAGCTDRHEWPAGWNPEVAFRFNTPIKAAAAALEGAAAAT